ncbi:MAG: hypothetical protein WCF48_17260, partial [Terriglobales bacterium]
MFQDESPLESHLERSTPLPLSASSDEEAQQRKRMLIALGVLLVALIAVVLRDWNFWFPPSAEVQEATAHRKTSSVAAPPVSAPAAAVHD